eukprot:5455497-Pleurochrysis_carterae.AAC.1
MFVQKQESSATADCACVQAHGRQRAGLIRWRIVGRVGHGTGLDVVCGRRFRLFALNFLSRRNSAWLSAACNKLLFIVYGVTLFEGAARSSSP